MKKLTALFLSLLLVLCSCAYAEGEACTHSECYTETDYTHSEYTVIDEYIHILTGEAIDTRTCMDCEEQFVGEPYALDNEEYHLYSPDGVCEQCGYVCKHPSEGVYEEYRDAAYAPKDEAFHEVTCAVYEITACNICSFVFSEKLIDEAAVSEENHYFIGGACIDCAAPNTCAHEETDNYEYSELVSCLPKDDLSHTSICDFYRITYCLNCGEEIASELVESGVETEESHSFYAGFCTACDAANTCAHESTESYDAPEFSYCVEKDEKQHTLVGRLYVSTYCLICGDTVSNELTEVNYREDADHWFSEGFCMECGAENTCTHENTEMTEELLTVDAVPKNAFFHTTINEQYNVYFCLDCGEEAARELVSDQYESVSNHWLWEGECSECGYVDDLGERARLMSYIVDAMDILSLLSEEADATAILLNADSVLTEAELSSFLSLDLTEQALVLLTAIGYDDAVQEAFACGLLTPSNELSDLLTAVSARIAALTADELTAREQQMDEYFPIVHTDDAGVPMRSMNLMITSPENNGAMTEVYSLLYLADWDQWSFEMTEAG